MARDPVAVKGGGTNFLVPSGDCEIAFVDANGLATFARCGVTPPTTAGIFATGCLMVRTDSPALYINVGTAGSPSWLNFVIND